MTVTIRRWIVILASLVVAAVLTYVVIYTRIPLGPVTFGFGTDMVKFAYSNVILLYISFAGIVGIWLDYFLNTQFLKS